MPDRWWAPVTGAETGRRPKSVLLILEEDFEEGGFTITGYGRDGSVTSQATWHGGRAAALEWAQAEHVPADIGRWHEVPRDVFDIVAYALRRM
jgi:hypothetical protein